MNHSEENFGNTLHQYNIWKQIKSPALQEQVVKYCYGAASLLDTVILTFNTYTLHNREHIFNVVKNMNELLGERANELTEYEAAFLLLSAFYHDIGMSYKRTDLLDITQAPHLQGFLDDNINAKLEFERTKPNLTEDFKLWYCRAVHHLRSRDFVLQNFGEKELNNYHIFAHELGQLCESHNWEIADVKNLPNDALADDVDLKFCALILRLADILDFDNSRSPEAIYKYLGLENAKDKAQKISDLEWRKHAAAKGFDFKKRNKDSRYDLHFTANPKHPAVEHDLRDFLDIIENELNGCQALVSNCSQRWQNFVFPNKILRDNIKSVGYKYGNYKFELQQDQVLNLLMGENLYGDKKVFLRELLQNAIDTSRFREVTERDNGNQDFKAEAIVISDWKDEDGYQWVRIDDYGMGMDEQIILNYFLKIGQSYYTSNEFKLEKLRFQNAQHQQFTPISRFGIGILSCFMVADKVEVSTRKKDKNALRLSLEDMQGFFTLKEETQHHKPDTMPCFLRKKEDYRKEIGSSIAIRLNPAKILDLNVEDVLEKYVYTSKLPIIYHDKKIGNDFETAIDMPILSEPFIYEFTEENMEVVNAGWETDFKESFILKIFPLDFSKYSSNKNYFRGQGLYIYLDVKEQIIDNTEDYEELSIDFKKDYHSNKFQIDITRTAKQWESGESFDLPDFNPTFFPLNIISHNGIVIEKKNEYFFSVNLINVTENEVSFKESIFYNLYLCDGQRINLNVARDRVLLSNWAFLSNFYLALFRNFEFYNWNKSLLSFEYIFSITTINTKNIPLDLSILEEYIKLPFFSKELLTEYINAEKKSSHISYNYLLELIIYYKYTVRLNRQGKLYLEENNFPKIENTNLFRPVFWIYFDQKSKLIKYKGYVNIEHPFSQWFLKNAKQISVQYPTYFNYFQSFLSYSEVHKTDILKEFNVHLKRLKSFCPDLFIGNEDIELN